MPSNTAAFLVGPGKPLEVKSAEYIAPAEHQLVIKNSAIAINPVDWKMQQLGTKMFPWMAFPHILGSDIAGEVAEIGPGVTRFKAGDRVCGLGQGVPSPVSQRAASTGGFQLYTVVNEGLVAPIPDTLTFEKAVVTPTGLSTAACGLYLEDFLGLNPPSLSPTPACQTVVIWGGSTGVGINAIQLAAASGYEVITTASPTRFDFVKSLGATYAYDYKSETAVRDIITVLKGKAFVGALAVGQGSLEACYEITSQSEGKKFVASCMPLIEPPNGVQSKKIFGNDIQSEVGSMIWKEFLPLVLAQGKYTNAPESEIVGHGLEAVQSALKLQGVSSKKLVVTL
ncbi:hypothetical protein NUU61_000833 [Penicillium alfredii]|uniref:Enoyl reductase (ER) domain-containing protein n=1 Tax=Penicillium alfredii TaxID=1506179 RepID=A0A9W9GAC2_9EURO|nr:uncharacterized protein NUU61_000833 [Penicillium alfredii]KAJ5115074.1 hypothetical protein NUU61_000833 [Penicillium alfredii]